MTPRDLARWSVWDFGENYQIRRVFCVTSLGGLYLKGLIHGVACEPQTHFWSSLLFLRREATTGNASAVRRLFFLHREWRAYRSAWESRDWDFKVSKMADFFKRVISSGNSNTDWKHPLKTFELLQFFAESTSYKLHKTLLDGEFFFVDKPVREAKSASAG